MIKYLIILILVVGLGITGLSYFLEPDDFSHCGTTPTTGKCDTAGAIVAISGGDTDARADQAIALYKNGWAPTIIFSGAAQDSSGPSNAQAMETRAENDGVPQSAILIDGQGATTEQNAINTYKILKQHSITSIILVTSGYHQRRASLEFHAAAKGVTVLNDPVKTDKDWSFWWWTTPRGWWLAGGESIKIIAFYIGQL